MLLPAGTIAALKRYPDAIVCVVIAFSALSAVVLKAPPWWVVVITALVLSFYLGLRRSSEAHEQAMAALKVQAAMAKAEAIRARHADLITYVQPSLPLVPPDSGLKRHRGT
jgi:hypothetical protein